MQERPTTLRVPKVVLRDGIFYAEARGAGAHVHLDGTFSNRSISIKNFSGEETRETREIKKINSNSSSSSQQTTSSLLSNFTSTQPVESNNTPKVNEIKLTKIGDVNLDTSNMSATNSVVHITVSDASATVDKNDAKDLEKYLASEAKNEINLIEMNEVLKSYYQQYHDFAWYYFGGKAPFNEVLSEKMNSWTSDEIIGKHTIDCLARHLTLARKDSIERIAAKNEEELQLLFSRINDDLDKCKLLEQYPPMAQLVLADMIDIINAIRLQKIKPATPKEHVNQLKENVKSLLSVLNIEMPLNNLEQSVLVEKSKPSSNSRTVSELRAMALMKRMNITQKSSDTPDKSPSTSAIISNNR